MNAKPNNSDNCHDYRPVVMLVIGIILCAMQFMGSFVSKTQPQSPSEKDGDFYLWLKTTESSSLPEGLYKFDAPVSMDDILSQTDLKKITWQTDKTAVPGNLYTVSIADDEVKVDPEIFPQAAPFFFKPVSINRADNALLETLPGIGVKLAQRIIDYRVANGPFKTIDDLRRVKGIGYKKLQKLLPHISL